MEPEIDTRKLRRSVKEISQSFSRMSESINAYCREIEKEIEKLQIERMKKLNPEVE